MLESWLADNALILAGFIATGGTALWRIASLEKRMEKQSENAREDRRRIYEKQTERLRWWRLRASCASTEIGSDSYAGRLLRGRGVSGASIVLSVGG